MQSTELKTFVTNILEEYKAVDVVALDVREMTTITDTMIICSGNSKRHVKTLSNQVIEKAKHANVQPLGVEGQDTAEWILVDLGDVVVHIMLPATREFYSLEKLWTTVEAMRHAD